MYHLLVLDEFDAAEARRCGLVQEVGAGRHPARPRSSLADKIAALAPLAIQATKASARLYGEQGEQACIAECRRCSSARQQEDAAEGVRSFVERREPRSRGASTEHPSGRTSSRLWGSLCARDAERDEARGEPRRERPPGRPGFGAALADARAEQDRAVDRHRARRASTGRRRRRRPLVTSELARLRVEDAERGRDDAPDEERASSSPSTGAKLASIGAASLPPARAIVARVEVERVQVGLLRASSGRRRPARGEVDAARLLVDGRRADDRRRWRRPATRSWSPVRQRRAGRVGSKPAPLASFTPSRSST